MSANTDFVIFALYELGGAGKFVHVEDIFKKCYDYSPGRFGWKKYPYPNYKTTYKALVDLETNYPELILKTEDGLGRQLTAEGIEWIQRNRAKLATISGAIKDKELTSRPSRGVLNDIVKHPLFIAFEKNKEIELSKFNLADLFLCSPDSPISLWIERMETLKSQAKVANHVEILKFLKHIEEQKPELFGGKQQ